MFAPTTLYLIRGVAALAELPQGQYKGAAAVARKVGAREQYLGKLFQLLSREGVLVSQKGLGGGFRLARDPGEITLFDLVEPIEHVSRYEGCLMGRGRCSDEKPCALHERWDRVRAAYLELLRETTVEHLVASGEHKRADPQLF